MSWSYRPELDGLRTFAVVIIIFFHAGVAGAQNSFIALDLFFVLSGFLVTNVVLSEIDARGRLALSRYYARRVRRLLPAAVVAIVMTSVVFLMVASQPERLALVRHAQAALVYLANWQFIAEGSDYFASDMRSSPFMHYWSLSIEEQYYIAFPLLILAWHKLAPGRGRVLLGILGALIALSVASQLHWAQVDPDRAYYATDARLFQLMAGAAFAVALREFARPSGDGGVIWPRLGRALAVTGLLGYAVFGSALVPMSVSNRNLLATLLASALVVGLYTARGSLAARAFSRPVPVYLGRISYGTYLWHWPAILVLQQVFTVRPVVVAVMAGVLATAMAALSYEVLESPIRRAKVLDAFHWRTVATGLGVSVVTAAVVVGPILTSERSPSLASSAAQQVAETQDTLTSGELNRRLRRPVGERDFTRLSKERGETGGHCTPDDTEACVRVDNDGPHVVLVGDSQARTFVPAFRRLAEEKGFKLSTSIVISCPWQDGLYNNNRRLDTCRDQRRDFYDRTLEAMGADAVVLVNLARSDPSWDGRLVDRDGRTAGQHELQLEATRRTVDKIHDAGAKAVIVNSLVGTGGWDREGFDPLACLARASTQGECVVAHPADRPIVDSYYDTLATQSPDTVTVDLNPLICPDAPHCLPIVRGRVVWRDQTHLTTSFLQGVREDIWSRIEETGVL